MTDTIKALIEAGERKREAEAVCDSLPGIKCLGGFATSEEIEALRNKEYARGNYRFAMNKALPDIAAMYEENKRMREALNLVLDTVGGCHDCWDLSATDEQKAFVSSILERGEV